MVYLQIFTTIGKKPLVEDAPTFDVIPRRQYRRVDLHRAPHHVLPLEDTIAALNQLVGLLQPVPREVQRLGLEVHQVEERARAFLLYHEEGHADEVYEVALQGGAARVSLVGGVVGRS